MLSLIARLVSTRERKDTTHHSFSVIHRNQDLFNEPSTGLHSLIPAITHILAPRPTLRLLTETTRSGFESLSSSACPSSATTTNSVTSATTVNNDDDDDDDDDDDCDDSAAPDSPWTCPPSAVPWPPQVCAAPLSTHHRLAPCAHVVRTPFLTPCGSNCAHVFVATNQPPPLPSPSSVLLTPATPRAPLLPFIVDAPFTCAVCVDGAVRAEKERRMGAFGGLLERNKEGLLDGEREVVAEAHKRILTMEMAEERGRVEEELGGRACEAAEERDGHGRCCP